MTQLSPYASKVAEDGRKYFARNHGIQVDVAIGDNTIEFPAPYDWAKVTGVEVINCEALDTAELKVYKDNVLLNQFSYTLNLPNDYYARVSKFDADFVKGLKLVVVYNSRSAKRIGLNFIMDEVK